MKKTANGGVTRDQSLDVKCKAFVRGRGNLGEKNNRGILINILKI